MKKNNFSKGKPHNKSKMGVLFGIPFLLLICGLLLISISGWNYFKQAYFLSRIFIHEEYKATKTTEAPASDIKIKFPKLGEEFGQIVIKTAAVDVPVFHGDRDEELLKGAGHFDGSRYPGENGNVVVSGHNNTAFKNLKNAKVGDAVEFNTTYGKYIYKVVNTKIVQYNDPTVVVPSEQEKLTLYTCYPFNALGYTSQRFVVTCELVEGASISQLMGKENGK
jgi:sortase A